MLGIHYLAFLMMMLSACFVCKQCSLPQRHKGAEEEYLYFYPILEVFGQMAMPNLRLNCFFNKTNIVYRRYCYISD